MKKYFLPSLLFALVFAFSFFTSSAQSSCLNLQNNLQYGAKDYFTDGEVTALQSFLSDKGYLEYAATGYFGRLTNAAVTAFQRENNLYAIGFVGPLTRNLIYNISCGYIPVPTNPTSIPVPQPTPHHCTLNGQTYYDSYSFNMNCRNTTTTPQTYYCSINGTTYSNYPSYQAGCTDPASNYRYCSLNGQTYNNLNDYNNYCRSNTVNYCDLNIEYQGGGFVATNDCTCPTGSTYTNTYSGGEIYKWKCLVSAPPTTCALNTEYTFAVAPNSGACGCPVNSTRVDLSNGMVGTNHFKCVVPTTPTTCNLDTEYIFPVAPNSGACSCPVNYTRIDLSNGAFGTNHFKCLP